MSHTTGGARGVVGDRDATLRRTQEWASRHAAEVLLADASSVFGREHLDSAALHAERAHDAGLMSTRSLSMEALLYLAGQRQVGDAIRVAGIKDTTMTVAVLVFGDGSVEDLVTYLGWSRDDGVLDAQGKDLALLGIRDGERGTVPGDRVFDLALERTALLDVVK